MRTTSLRQFTLLVGIGGLLAVSAQYACTDSSCNTLRTGSYQTMDEITSHRIETLDEALTRQGVVLTAVQRDALARDGRLLGVVTLDRPVRHPDGSVEMPAGWLPPIPDGHPWAKPLSPPDDAFYSWFEERIVEARLFDPASPTHMGWARGYLAKVASTDGAFRAWTYASATDCPKK